MDFRLTAEQEQLRGSVRGFLDQTIPTDWKPRAFIFQSEAEWQVARQFDLKVAERQWLTSSWSTDVGGLGFDPLTQMVLDQEFALAGAPDGGARGHGPHFVGPAILKYGSPEQLGRFIPGIVEGSDIWAQCFSELGAGSDMANVSTTAVRDGDDYIINGTKLWTGQGHRAKYAILTARTSEDAPKHRSLSLFMVDLRAEGVDIQPLWTLPRHGRLNAEVFENVRVPASNRLGEENEAWRLMVDVMNKERSNIAVPANAKRILTSFMSDLRNGNTAGTTAQRAAVRLAAAEVAISIEVAMMLNYRIAWMLNEGQHPAHEASMVKLMGATITQSLAQMLITAYGLRALLLPEQGGVTTESGDWIGDYWLQSVQASIVSGSSEIMRNVIATRGLGMPRG